jgi:hypothetical protein
MAVVTVCPQQIGFLGDEAAMLTEKDTTGNLYLQYLCALSQFTNERLTAAKTTVIRRNARVNLMFSVSARLFFFVDQTLTVLGAVLLFI